MMKRLVASAVLLCFVVLAFSSVIIGITHSGHNCIEKTCFSCNAVKELKAVITVLFAVVSLLIAFTLVTVSGSRKVPYVNLVEFKTRMNH
ncbi:MAG: hypothetical protein FWG33_02980 [Oscillospiraceae bacterium]|nr:hypothetical protein [Oscillospiraceae bacterium]